ncbi:3-ketoacyl-CoA thiolase [Anaerovibrio sp. JC8]|uniref:thiolase family protein n=1 Tax=Anaerovibrio sp. JC8 TaxID=1240085 RepID=UPI000A0B14FA|nr:thiolase family protein [Anaerovibrio sp. JC8]ORT99965.1 3-ketoacyl-CoA thiolase [Anaerovibrio sp. JC8]
MEKVYVLWGRRTPIVTKNNKFKFIPAEKLGAFVVQAIMEKLGPGILPDGVIAGNAVGTGGNIARLMCLTAGLPEEVPAFTVDMQCASGAAAIAMGYAQIASGNGDMYICGGMESSSLQPVRIYNARDERYSHTPQGDGRYMTAQFSPGKIAEDAMLRGAEATMEAEKVTKEELDFWTLRSHQLATECAQKELLKEQIVPVEGITQDDGIRSKMNQRFLGRLPRILGEGSLLTAGNSCLINDGAAFVVLVSGKWLQDHPEFSPQAEILGTCAAGGSPVESPRGAMLTADKLLARHDFTYGDMAAIEFNEAFAVIDVLFQRKYPDLIDRYNMLGGALAYGHPYGASGGIIMIHLLRALELRHGSLGILSIAGAGGMGQSILVKKC